jgi:hypothetical protein
MRTMYQSKVAVLRLVMKLTNGVPHLTWNPIPDLLDPFIEIPGQMLCRIDLGFIKRGQLAPMPVMAGRAPDRVGTAFFDPAINPDTGAPFVLAGDRLQCLSGPVIGTFEIREIPYAAITMAGPHHIEVEVIEVAKSIAQGSQTPFPGSEGPDG